MTTHKTRTTAAASETRYAAKNTVLLNMKLDQWSSSSSSLKSKVPIDSYAFFFVSWFHFMSLFFFSTSETTTFMIQGIIIIHGHVVIHYDCIGSNDCEGSGTNYIHYSQEGLSRRKVTATTCAVGATKNKYSMQHQARGMWSRVQSENNNNNNSSWYTSLVSCDSSSSCCQIYRQKIESRGISQHRWRLKTFPSILFTQRRQNLEQQLRHLDSFDKKHKFPWDDCSCSCVIPV